MSTPTSSAEPPSSSPTTSSAPPPSSQRHNGWERPYSRDQVISWLGHSVSALCFYLGAAGMYLTTESGEIHAVTLVGTGVHAVNALVLLTAWTSCETIDPAIETEGTSWWGVTLRGPRWDTTRYCALCRKAVPGLDHHCTWLQTCVGKSNYVQFFTVACTGTVQFVLQVVYACVCGSWLLSHRETTLGYVPTSALLVCFALSVPCMCMYFVLVGFHLWLMVLGYGTYEWMLRRREDTSRASKRRETRPRHPEAVEEATDKDKTRDTTLHIREEGPKDVHL
ncbi:hypothetical protein PsorP6_017988 [Peronosclerospora sorghi]|uniref:Uncharacterized protein n=1 Tax=Peronosclerospora sorghi TaxID=230839 RepID=A0ACC0WCE5_9STRA|nr:hypothetical protein PsorP6_017988 [Peronosclerospora sorghi]